MPETCWEIVKNKHLTLASCWFSLSLHNLSYNYYVTGIAQSVYWLATGWTGQERNPGLGEIIRVVHTTPEAYLASCTTATGSFPRVKQPERGADHPPPSSTGLWMGLRYIATSPLFLRRWPLPLFGTLTVVRICDTFRRLPSSIESHSAVPSETDPSGYLTEAIATLSLSSEWPGRL